LLIYRYKRPAVSGARKNELLSAMKKNVSEGILDVQTEHCFYIGAEEPLAASELEILRWLIAETFEPDKFSEKSFLADEPTALPSSPLAAGRRIIEVGPRMNFTTAWSTNAVSICHSCGLTKIARIERSRRYRIEAERVLSEAQRERFLSGLYDRMTECPYPKRLETFETGIRPEAF
jgi:phosphoribosylformylglycinamidine synthase